MIHNPYWDALADLVEYDPHHGRVVRDTRGSTSRRRRLTAAHAATITDPDTVNFVADHVLNARLIDPLAGTGYWAYLLQQHGIDTFASDLHPPDHPACPSVHAGYREWVPVWTCDAVNAVTGAGGTTRTLLLAWPPQPGDDTVSAPLLAAYTGPRVIYAGEPAGGSTGSDDLHDLLTRDWVLRSTMRPVRWRGNNDVINIYDRLETR